MPVRCSGSRTYYADFAMQVLTNGIEVKLQRNALSVLEAPTGNEEDDDVEFENLQWNGSGKENVAGC